MISQYRSKLGGIRHDFICTRGWRAHHVGGPSSNPGHKITFTYWGDEKEATVSGHLYNVLNTCARNSYVKLQVRILTEPKNALVPQYQMLFGMDKVNISAR